MKRLRTLAPVVLALFLALVLTSALASCSTLPTPGPVPLPTYSPTSCSDACDHAAALCGPGALKPKNGTCFDVCNATESNGGDFRTGCFSAATTCEQVEACSR